MAQTHMGSLSSLRRQKLLAEFTGLQQACPEGVIVSLTPGDPSLWSGVMFVRKGPYADAVLRFHISFPDMYPRSPPLVTFSTDIFHPLITPLSNHAYTAGLHDGAAAAGAPGEGRLPPGGLSLRHGFPAWFSGRREEAAAGPPRTPPRAGGSVVSTPESRPTPAGETPRYMRSGEDAVSTYDVLWYIRSVFDDDEVLDGVGVRAAGNPGAWYAWRSHRKAMGKAFEEEEPAAAAGKQMGPAGNGRDPGSWDWDGVWEDRVKKGIASSLSEPVLYGGASGADDVIRFQALEESDVETVKVNIIRTLGVSM